MDTPHLASPHPVVKRHCPAVPCCHFLPKPTPCNSCGPVATQKKSTEAEKLHLYYQLENAKQQYLLMIPGCPHPRSTHAPFTEGLYNGCLDVSRSRCDALEFSPFQTGGPNASTGRHTDLNSRKKWICRPHPECQTPSLSEPEATVTDFCVNGHSRPQEY